jgi:hypothetical protein
MDDCKSAGSYWYVAIAARIQSEKLLTVSSHKTSGRAWPRGDVRTCLHIMIMTSLTRPKGAPAVDSTPPCHSMAEGLSQWTTIPTLKATVSSCQSPVPFCLVSSRLSYLCRHNNILSYCIHSDRGVHPRIWRDFLHYFDVWTSTGVKLNAPAVSFAICKSLSHRFQLQQKCKLRIDPCCN